MKFDHLVLDILSSYEFLLTNWLDYSIQFD